jgi:hypothetical protein
MGASGTREERVEIRMMTDDTSGVALWPDLHWDYPGSKVQYLFESDDEVENLLTISPALRERIRAWVDEYTESISPGAPLDPHHDRRGYVLSRELQDELGPDFKVTYHLETEELRREVKARRGDPRR